MYLPGSCHLYQARLHCCLLSGDQCSTQMAAPSSPEQVGVRRAAQSLQWPPPWPPLSPGFPRLVRVTEGVGGQGQEPTKGKEGGGIVVMKGTTFHPWGEQLIIERGLGGRVYSRVGGVRVWGLEKPLREWLPAVWRGGFPVLLAHVNC